MNDQTPKIELAERGIMKGQKRGARGSNRLKRKYYEMSFDYRLGGQPDMSWRTSIR